MPVGKSNFDGIQIRLLFISQLWLRIDKIVNVAELP